jgi:predicted ATPase/DNA-binding SARP family transcriptional activator
MAHLVLNLFGSPRAALDQAPVSISRRKAVALLTYLAVTGRPHNRDALAVLLFPEYDQTGARENFRRILSALHDALAHQWLQIDRVTVTLPPSEALWVDVHHFHHLLATVRRHAHPPNEVCAACLTSLEEATALYRDDFLRGFTLADAPDFDDWQRSQSEQLRMELGEVLELLGWGYAAQGVYSTALTYARRRVELDPLHEPAHRQLMQLYAQAGQQGDALRQYSACLQILQAEFRAPPSLETTALLEAIKTGSIGTARKSVIQSSEVRRESAPPDEPQLLSASSHVSAAEHVLPVFLTPQPPSASTETSVFVARRLQLMQLRHLLNHASLGQGQVVFVTGEAGSGKTALLHEFARQAQEAMPDLVVANGVCNAYTGMGDPYLAFREILAMLTGDVESRWLAGAISRGQAWRLWSLFPRAVDLLLDVGPNLIDTFIQGSALTSRALLYPPDQPWRERLQAQLVHGQQQRPEQRRLFEEYGHVLRSLAVSHPLLLVLDDLHWADASSLSLLFYLGRQLGRSRIMVVGAYRPEDVAQGWRGEPHPLTEIIHEFQRQYGDIQVPLESDANAEGRYFVDALLDVAPNRLDEAFRQALFRQSSGHALFTSELLRDLQDRGVLVKDETGVWVKGLDLDWSVLPAQVEGVIARRLDRLDAQAREVLSVASVEGENFTAEVVAHVLGLDERQLVRLLGSELDRRHHLVQAQEVRLLGSRRWSRYRFRHNLFQRYLYTSLDEAERMYLHETVGTLLEAFYGEQPEPLALIGAQLAYHFQQAGRVEKAIEYRLLAGQQAVQVAANQEAVDHLQAGLALLQTLPDTPERMRRELALQLTLGVPVTALRGYAHAEVERVYTRAHALGLQLGETKQLFPALYGLCRMAGMRGELRAAQVFNRQLMDLAQSTQELPLLMEAYRTSGINTYHLGELVAARTVLAQSLALYDPQQHNAHAFVYGHDPAVSCLGYLGHILWLLGYPTQAQAKGQELFQLAQNLSHPFSLGHTYIYGTAILAQLRREAPAVQQLAQAGIALATEHKFPFWQTMGTVLLGWSLAQQGQTTLGIAQMSDGIVNWQTGGAKLLVPYFLGLLAQAYGWVGQFDKGLDAIDQAFAVVEQTGERWYEAELHRLRGELRWLAGASEAEVETLFQSACAVAGQQQAKSLELRATMSLCRLWHKQGKRSVAHALLTEVYDWFSEGFDTSDLQEAGALLEALA